MKRRVVITQGSAITPVGHSKDEIVKSLVEGMGGLLEVETTTGVGTTFSVMFELPMVPNYPKDERGKSARESALCLKQKKRTAVNR